MTSHVSVGSIHTQATSVVATCRYFGSTRWTPTEINARRVIFPKTACGAHGSRNYSRHQEAATCALPHYALAKYFHAKNAEGEASNKYAKLLSKYASKLAKIKNFKRHMDISDMSNPLVTPQLINPYPLIVDNCWAERKIKELGQAYPPSMLQLAV